MDVFASPTQTVKDKTVRSDVITTAYANQLWAVHDLKSMCVRAQMNVLACVCVCKYMCTLFLW